MLVLSVAVPALERSELVNAPVAESEHQPGTCPAGHDHTICTQVGANLALRTQTHEHGSALVVRSAPTPVESIRVQTTSFAEGHPSRAPPRT
jgi:hypothetical protein